MIMFFFPPSSRDQLYFFHKSGFSKYRNQINTFLVSSVYSVNICSIALHRISRSFGTDSDYFCCCCIMFWLVEQRLKRRVYHIKELNKSRDSLVPLLFQTQKFSFCFHTVFLYRHFIHLLSSYFRGACLISVVERV